MRSMLAMIHARWRTAASYRIRMILSIASLAVTVVPLYFVANALQPVMAESIQAEGGEYFAFLIVGMVTFLLLPAAVNALPGEVSGKISKSILEALLGTQSRLVSILGGMIGFNLIWTLLRAAILLMAGWVLGASIVWSQFFSGALILGLIVLAYLPFGLIASALVVAFRTAGPLGQGVLVVSSLLGGVYYPTTVIPSWIQSISDFVPLTYGLRALRGTLLEGMSLASVMPDIGMLLVFVAVLTAIGWGALTVALSHARRAGTLAQY